MASDAAFSLVGSVLNDASVPADAAIDGRVRAALLALAQMVVSARGGLSHGMIRLGPAERGQ